MTEVRNTDTTSVKCTANQGQRQMQACQGMHPSADLRQRDTTLQGPTAPVTCKRLKNKYLNYHNCRWSLGAKLHNSLHVMRQTQAVQQEG